MEGQSEQPIEPIRKLSEWSGQSMALWVRELSVEIVFNKVEAKFLAPVVLMVGQESSVPPERQILQQRIRKDFKKRVLCGRGMSPCTENKQNKKSYKKKGLNKGKVRACQLHTPIEILLSCSLKIPVRIPRHYFALYQGHGFP